MDSDSTNQSSFPRLAAATRELYDQVRKLQKRFEVLQPPALEGQEWFESLRQKLIPQLGEDAWLVAAVVGGTNIGKSVIFNHLARCRASSTSPLASGTKHPVCLVPAGFDDRQDLQSIFPDFTLHEWSDAAAALRETDRHDLFWRPAPELPPTLLVLDTPDIDSDARVNWVRADAVRRCADVLIAVLTQQKYNDAAVKEFFRKAGAEDKSIMVVFNQCLLPDDEEFWPIWLNTFCRETGITPDAVYLAPADRQAAESLKLPFFERPWPVEPGWKPSSAEPAFQQPRDLSADLARLKFQEVRIRTLQGSLRHLVDPVDGVPGHLSQLQSASSELAAASERLSTDAVLRIRDWPIPSNTAFVTEIRSWWKQRQQGWARTVNSVYDTVGAGIKWPFRKARDVIQGEPIPPLDRYRDREWSAVLTTIEELFDKLQWMADSGNRLIKPRVESILKASSRSELIEKLRLQHQRTDFEKELRDVVSDEMQRFSTDSPELFRFYKNLHNVSAAVRPMTSVVLFSLGFGPAGETVAPFVADAAAQAVIHVFADVAGGATAAVAGEVAVAEAAGTGAGILQTYFQNLHASFTKRRVNWLTEQIHAELLGTLPEELKAASAVTESVEFRNVTELIEQLRKLIAAP
ncbi:MAG: GTPase [Planctomycetaceae bacterium]